MEGRRTQVSPETQAALLAAMRLPAATDRQALESLRDLAEAHDRRAVPFARSLRAGEPMRIGSPARRDRAKGTARRSCASARSRSDSSAWRSVAAGRRIAARSAAWVSGLTCVRRPSTSHHSGAIPAAAARRARTAGSTGRAFRDGAGVSPRTTTERGEIGTASSLAGSRRASSALSLSTHHSNPSRGSGRSRCKG